MRRSVTFVSASALLAASLLAALLVGSTTAGAASPTPNPWLHKGFLNMAHQGGEDEAPSNTLFAFKSAIRDRGADTLELDVNLTSDGELVVIHDDTVNRTTQETGFRTSGASEVDDLTLEQIQELDAGYTFRPGGHYDKSQPASAYPYRGMSETGGPTPPSGYARDDFQIPTMRQVLDAFPNTPINIEIKLSKVEGGTLGGCTTQNDGMGNRTYCDDVAASTDTANALAALLDEPAYRDRTDILVVSFSDALIAQFHSQDALPKQVTLAAGQQAIINYVLSGGLTTPNPDVAAFQVPPSQSPLSNIPEYLMSPGSAHDDGYAIHVWANGTELSGDYARFVKLGVEGYMASSPGQLAAYLCANEIPRPDGTDRCPNAAPTPPAAKKCKKGQKLKKGKCVKKKKKRKKHRGK